MEEQNRSFLNHQIQEDQTIYGIDLFLRCLYDYWQHGGMTYLLVRKLSALVKSFTVFSIVIVTFFCIDYTSLALLSTQNSESLPTSSILQAPKISFVSFLCIFGCGAYLLYETWKTFNQIQQAWTICQFYKHQLDITTDEQLYWTPWKIVCQRLKQFQQRKWQQECNQRQEQEKHNQNQSTNHFRQQMFDENSNDNQQNEDAQKRFEQTIMLTEDNISSMIMRRENYWIALVSDNLLAFDSESDPNSKSSVSDCEDNSIDASSSDFQNAFKHTQSPVADNLFGSTTHFDRSGSFSIYQSDSEDDSSEIEQRPLLTGVSNSYNWLQGWQKTAPSVFIHFKRILAPLFVTQCDEQLNSEQCRVLEKPILTRTLQWCLSYSLFSFAIDSHTGALKHELALFVENGSTFAEREQKRNFRKHTFDAAGEWHRAKVSQPLVEKLVWRFRAMAIVGALLSPLLFVLVVLSFFFEHGDQVRREPGQSLGAREWSNEARWTFRQYNELPHIFEARLARSAVVAKRYSESFVFSALGETARCIAFVAAAVLFVFLLIGVVGDEEALSMVHFALGRSAFWWITTLTLVIAALRSLVPTAAALLQETLWRADADRRVCNENVFQQNQVPVLETPTSPKTLCETMASFTHYYPLSWFNKEHTEQVRDRFFCLFASKWLTYVREVLGIVYTPYLLWFVFPGKARQFLDFFVERTERRAKVGHVCARENTESINVSEIV